MSTISAKRNNKHYFDKRLGPSKEDLRIQYQQCIENYRLFDRHVWQVPSVTILIGSAIVGVAFGPLKDDLIASTILLLFGIMMSFSMFIAVKKYRFFQYYAIERMRKIEKELLLEPLPLITGKNGMKPRNCIERQRAGDWLSFTVLLVFISLIGLLLLNIMRFMVTLN